MATAELGIVIETKKLDSFELPFHVGAREDFTLKGLAGLAPNGSKLDDEWSRVFLCPAHAFVPRVLGAEQHSVEATKTSSLARSQSSRFIGAPSSDGLVAVEPVDQPAACAFNLARPK